MNDLIEQQQETEGAPDAPYNAPPERQALVKKWLAAIDEARTHEPTAKAFKKMRRNMRFAARGADDDWDTETKYTVPILVRHINQSVSALYAKNPSATVTRKRRLMYKMWDGRSDSLEAAMELAQMGDESAMQMLQEILSVRQYNQLLDKMAKSLEIAWDYYLNEQEYNYKQQFKALVRRTKVCGVGYVKLGYQRILEPRPETGKIEDVTDKLQVTERLLKQVSRDEIEEEAPEMEQLRTLLQDLQNEPQLLLREGPVLDFPRATEIVVDVSCRHLKSFAGARWVAQLYEMTPDDVEETYGVDIRQQFKAYAQDGDKWDEKKTSEKKAKCARVWEVWDKKDRQCLTICEGYCDFLKEPAEPDIKIERFYPFFPLVFNEIESEDEIYPPSDIDLAKHIQNEYNRTREAYREHRIASRPYYVEAAGLEEAEKKKLANHAAHEIVSVPTLGTGQKAEDLIQRGPTVPIDPNLYEVNPIFEDLLRTVGTQEANLGGLSGGSATESSIAEQSRSTSQADNVDDLDELLTDLSKAAGQLMLTECSKETIVEIVGDGAVWPDSAQTRDEVAKDLLLEIEAGSSGRPNQAAELANMERAAPFLMQIPGVNMTPVAKRYLRLLNIDVDEAIAEGVPSATALNAIISKMGAGGPGSAEGAQPTGNADSDPNQQGGAGAQNAPNPRAEEPGAQPAYMPPAAVG